MLFPIHKVLVQVYPPTLANRESTEPKVREVCVWQAADLVAGEAGAQRVTES